jgi:hypothetical protein
MLAFVNISELKALAVVIVTAKAATGIIICFNIITLFFSEFLIKYKSCKDRFL